MVLGVFAHSSLAYAPFAGPHWPIIDTDQSQTAAVIFGLIYLFRLPAFFFLSGYFARLLLSKRSREEFTTNRLKRIVIPLLVAFIPLRLAEIAAVQLVGGNVAKVWDNATKPGHLWFLYYLSLTLAAYLLLTIRPEWTNGKWMNNVDRAFKHATSLASPLLFGLLVIPSLAETSGIQTPIHFIPDFWILWFYAIFFAGGVVFHRNPGLMDRLGRGLPLRLGLALTALVAVAVFPGGLIHYYARGVFAWAMTFAFVGFFVRFFATANRFAGYLADASYWTYIVHPPIVFLLQGLLVTLLVGALLKFAVVAVATFAVCFMTYAALVRPTRLNSFVGGRRRSAA